MKKFHTVKWLKKKKGDILQRAPEDGGKVQISVLYLCTMIKESNRMRAHSNIATLARVGNDNVSEEDCNDICDLFSAIKTVIVPPSIMSKEQTNTLTPRGLLDHGLSNFTPLMAAFYGLATGEPKRELDKINNPKKFPDHQSQMLAVIAAHDIILRCSLSYPCQFQLMLSEQLEMQKVSKVFREMLSAFRLVSNLNSSNKKLYKTIVNSLMKGVHVGSNDMCLCNGDNVGFTVLGENARYDQWTLLQDIVLRQPRLLEIGLHIPNDRDKQLCRKPAEDWLELANEAKVELDEEELARKVVGVNDDDIRALSRCVLEDIQLVIDLVVEDGIKVGEDIPRLGYIVSHESRQMLASGKIEVGTDVLDEDDGEDVDEGRNNSSTAATTASTNQSTAGRASTPNNNDTADSSIRHGLLGSDIEKDNDDDVSTHRTNPFYGNNITLNPVKADLGKKQTTCAILHYVWSVRKKVLTDWYKEYEKEHMHPPPLDIDISELPPAYVGAIFMCDGQPAAKISSIIAADNRSFYLGKTDATFPDELFPDESDKDKNTEFDEWFHAINSHFGFVGKSHSIWQVHGIPRSLPCMLEVT